MLRKRGSCDLPASQVVANDAVSQDSCLKPPPVRLLVVDEAVRGQPLLVDAQRSFDDSHR